MTADYFESKKTGGGKDSIEITVEVKSDKVVDFANEIASEVKGATIDRVLEIVDDALSVEETAIKAKWNQVQIVKQIKDRVLALKGGKKE